MDDNEIKDLIKQIINVTVLRRFFKFDTSHQGKFLCDIEGFHDAELSVETHNSFIVTEKLFYKIMHMGNIYKQFFKPALWDEMKKMGKFSNIETPKKINHIYIEMFNCVLNIDVKLFDSKEIETILSGLESKTKLEAESPLIKIKQPKILFSPHEKIFAYVNDLGLRELLYLLKYRWFHVILTKDMHAELENIASDEVNNTITELLALLSIFIELSIHLTECDNEDDE